MALNEAVAAAVQEAMSAGQTPGAVVLVGEHDRLLLHEAYGDRMVTPERRSMQRDTVFDLASLTKPLSTALAIMQLADRGVLDPEDPVARWLPAYTGPGRDETTLRHLLTHSSGLPAYRNYLHEFGDSIAPADRRRRVVADLCQVELQHAPGTAFVYSCLGYVLLASVVEAAARQPLDRWFATEIAAPLGLVDTGFCPDAGRRERCAATEMLPEGVLLGVVHDENARYLGGVGGNAGLFSTATEVSRLVRLMLRGGELDGVRLLSKAAVRRMTTPELALPEAKRGLGWDLDSDYSPALRGQHWPAGISFGHSGYTGTSAWADPVSGRYAIVLTNRVHFGREVGVQDLRRAIANLAATA